MNLLLLFFPLIIFLGVTICADRHTDCYYTTEKTAFDGKEYATYKPYCFFGRG